MTNTVPTVDSVLQGTSNWRDAAFEACKFYVDQGQCFSSGEVARDLRTHRTDLKFSVMGVGEYLRDLFYGGGMPDYQALGMTMPVQQVGRTTTGKGRTPAGRDVFVYCPDPTEGYNHDFEVDIPRPPVDGGFVATGILPGRVSATRPTGAPALTPVPVGATPSGIHPPHQSTYTRQPTAKAANITGKAPKKDPEAKVHTDRRLCISRNAFEAFVHLTKTPMKGGDPIYLSFDGDTATVTLDQVPGSKPYSLATERGRILFPSPNKTKSFAPGKTTPVTITAKSLSVNLADVY